MSKKAHVISEKNDDSSSSDSIYPSSEDEASSTEIENFILESNIKADNSRSSRNKKYEKWMNFVLNAKKAMLSSEWSNLLAAIQKLEKAFKSNNTNPLGLFTPILARFLLELDEFFKKHPVDKKYRKNLKSGEAKACNAVQQRSQQLIRLFNSIILEYLKNPPPIKISSSNVRVVDVVEKFLTIPPHYYLSLRNLNLHEYFLTILDLSRNRLRDFPYEILHFRHLKVLCISHNLFQYFPPYITKIARNTVILGVKSNPLLKTNVHKFQNVNNINREDVPRLMDICAQAIILKKIPLKRRKLKVFTNIQQQIVPDIIINFIQQGFLCESCRLFISPSSSLFLQPIIEYMKYTWKLDKIIDDQQISTTSYQDLPTFTNIPLFRRFCVQCWQIHNERENSKCICVTCKVERATDKNDITWIRLNNYY
ncbi:14678_t:CDS:2 [Funneliformis geosporum]|uniref:6898_t:CDS:1 n=1 Tax=Funneliformis geosporum TaxID=1117311 RepID=A0A9W4T1B7_9GLOM|nr:6898_t:CDS:2 [Funneliformis geosporum]CAI2187013.1 14678_t:CDS:2 [Funneliformis geosporum]